MTETVAILDYGMGNLHSVAKALEKVASDQKVSGQKVLVTSDPAVVATADRVIFPGVGAIRDCMRELHERGLDQAIREVVGRGTPLLGVCVGMQALMSHSEENGGVECLGVFPGKVVRFTDRYTDLGERLKVPHMGWNQVRQSQHHPMWEGLDDYSRFYFVHSYHVADLPEDQLVGSCDYGFDFPAAVCRGNVFAVQFHPEKSASHGLLLLENFLRWAP